LNKKDSNDNENENEEMEVANDSAELGSDYDKEMYAEAG